RRASGWPAEQTFATLIGLELRPRRLRDAARLWASLSDARGPEGRDALWEHPDMLPTAADLDDPDGFVHHEQADFSELDRMLGDAAGGGTPGEGEGADGPAAEGPGSEGDGPKGEGRKDDGPK
ncbi:zinc-dependent metalloprotease, partial [Streptomyces sparsus]